MLKAMWMMPACMKPDVTSRQYSPFSTSIAFSARSPVTEPPPPCANELPPAEAPMNSSTQIAIST